MSNGPALLKKALVNASAVWIDSSRKVALAEAQMTALTDEKSEPIQDTLTVYLRNLKLEENKRFQKTNTETIATILFMCHKK
jgi:hypothetical protein